MAYQLHHWKREEHEITYTCIHCEIHVTIVTSGISHAYTNDSYNHLAHYNGHLIYDTLLC